MGFDSAIVLSILGAIASLVILEGLLSADNALVLAVMVRHLPKDQQKRALRYGIWGAFLFRFIAVIFASLLLDFWQLKVLGGVYLLYIAISHLIFGEEIHELEKPRRFGSGFWGTVIGVELADIAFSIDSILAAVAMADSLPDRVDHMEFSYLPVKLWIIYIGGILGIITMRFVAGLFLVVLKRFGGLALGAYVLVGWIGLHLIGGGLHNALHPKGPPNQGWRANLPSWVHDLPLEMPEWLFWGGMGLIIVLSLLYQPKTPPTDLPEDLVEAISTDQDPDGRTSTDA